MSRTRTGLLLAVIALWGTHALAGAVELRDDAEWDKVLSLDLHDAGVRQVLALAFRVAHAPVVIDDCVSGRVSLQFDKVPVRDAVTATARIANLEVRPRSEGYYVGCAAEDSPASATDSREGPWLHFALLDATAGEVVTRSSLQVQPRSLAQIDTRGVRGEDLDDTGTFYPGEPRSNLRVEVYLNTAEDDAGADSLRGILEMTVADDDGRRVLRTATTSFEVPLPPGATGVELVELELGGHDYVLKVTREEP